MIKCLVLFLVRRKLGLQKYESFRFANQKSERNFYWIGGTTIWKAVIGPRHCLDFQHVVKSNVSLNYLLSDECEVVKVKWE